jgi:rubrerythrin
MAKMSVVGTVIMSTRDRLETDRIEAQTLIELYEDDELTDTAMAELVEDHDIDLDDTDHQICPDCGDGVIRRQEGCNLCPVCGYSKC